MPATPCRRYDRQRRAQRAAMIYAIALRRHAMLIHERRQRAAE